MGRLAGVLRGRVVGGLGREGVEGGVGVEAEVDGGGSTPIVVSILFFLKSKQKLL